MAWLRTGVGAGIVLMVLVLGGCATSRSELKLESPGAGAASPRAGAPVAVIHSVNDERTFEQAPDEPSTPSLGFEGAQQASAAVKLRAIGRKRNTFGKALGDVLLQEGQTVEGVVREHLGAALSDAGFDVRADAGTAPAALLLDVRIRKFWSWVQPGFWAITVHAEVATDIQPVGRAEVLSIATKAEDARQFATEAAWLETVDKALQAYRREAVPKLATLK